MKCIFTKIIILYFHLRSKCHQTRHEKPIDIIKYLYLYGYLPIYVPDYPLSLTPSVSPYPFVHNFFSLNSIPSLFNDILKKIARTKSVLIARNITWARVPRCFVSRYSYSTMILSFFCSLSLSCSSYMYIKSLHSFKAPCRFLVLLEDKRKARREE